MEKTLCLFRKNSFYSTKKMFYLFTHNNVKMFKLLRRSLSSQSQYINCNNNLSTSTKIKRQETDRFETVFAFPFVKYFGIFNRLKVYHFAGTGIVLPTCGLLEVMNVIPSGTLSVASYIGLTAAAVLSLSSLPFHNIIGFIYVSEDNKKIKIASVNYWGYRKDRLIPAEDWIPLYELKPKVIDGIYITPKLTDGTKYKLFLKFGNIQNPSKMVAVLE